jgi:putative DNA primase/helicase
MIEHKRGVELAANFQKKYASTQELTFKVVQKPEDVYGQQAIEQGIENAEGAYHPQKKLVVMFTDNAKDEARFTETIKHEVFGHYALNTLEKSQKESFIKSIQQSRNEPSLQDTWQKVDKAYPNLSETLKAEEVYAFTAQKTQENPMIVPPELRGAMSLAATPLTATHLKVIAKKLSKELEDGSRSQQIFPENDQTQFAKAPRKKYPPKAPQKPLHEQVAEKLIKQIEEGTAPWQKPWENGNFAPYNASTGARYKGGNSLWLSMQERSDPRWLTYKQAQDMNAQVRKGEKGTTIEYWKFHDEKAKRDDNGNIVKDSKGNTVMLRYELDRPKVFTASVFNAEQIDGLPELEKREITWNPNERAEKIMQNSGVPVNYKPGNKAYYTPSKHEITMPFKDQFTNDSSFYGVYLHELSHSTGNINVLNRDLSGSFGSALYAKEELRAEISSSIVSQEIGIPPDTGRNAAYVEHWVKILKDDPKEIFRAAKDAEKISEYILNLEREKAKDINTQSINEENPSNTAALALAEKLSAKINNPQDQQRFIESIQQRINQQPDLNTDIKINEKAQQSEAETER